jgi:hypothetical protein
MRKQSTTCKENPSNMRKQSTVDMQEESKEHEEQIKQHARRRIHLPARQFLQPSILPQTLADNKCKRAMLCARVMT